MQLGELIDGLGNQSVLEANFLYLERYVNDAKGSFKDFSDVDPRFSPEDGMSRFGAPFVWLPNKHLTIIDDAPSHELRSTIFRGDSVLFVWHPDIQSQFHRDGEIVVSATSSTRTLLTREMENNFMAKTDLDKRHFRFIRRLKGSSVRHSIDVSRDIRLATELDDVPFYAYMPEVIGLVYGDLQTGTGVIYRELTPRPFADSPRFIIPYFALYSRDTNFPMRKPLMVELINRNSVNDPLEFFVEVLVGMVQDTWAYFVSRRGILPELHGQNVCLEVDANGCPTRLVHRDFQSIYSDCDIRSSLSLPQFKKHHAGDEDNITKGQQYSLVFDHFICTYLLSRMVKTFVNEYPQYEYDDVVGQIRNRFRNIPGNRLDVFPEAAYRFAKRKMIGNEVTLEIASSKPVFR